MEVFRNNAHKVIPDPAVYDEWFRSADLRRRRLSVGSRRYAAARSSAGHEPTWAHFVDPGTGNLVSLKQLKAESQAVRAARVQEVEKLIAQRAADVRSLATFGFLP